MKTLLKLLLLVAAIWVVWGLVKQKEQAGFRYRLPPVSSAAEDGADTLPPVYFRPLPHISATAAPEQKAESLSQLSRLLFDTLKLESLRPGQIQRSSLATIDTHTLIQLMNAQRSGAVGPERLQALITVSLLLRDQKQSLNIVKTWLMPEQLWLAAARRHHRLLMQEPGNPALQYAFINLLTPATTRQTLDYFREVQYLEKDPWEDNYRVYPQVLERFDKNILSFLLDKVDDYPWYAAYPERDAEQGILELLRKK